MTSQEHIPSTSSATVCSNIVCSDVTPGTPQEQSPSPVATSPTTVFFDTASSDVLCETVSCDLECTHTSSDLTSPADTSNSKTEYNKSESRCGITMVNVGMQFPLDVSQEIFSEHSYCSFKVLKEKDSSEEALQIAPLHATLVKEVEVSDELNFSSPAYQEIESVSIDSDELNFCPPSPEIESVSIDYDPDYEYSSQSSQTSTEPSVDENDKCFNTSGAKRILLVYEDNLRELFKFCPKCGSPVNTEEIEERENEGTQYSVKINCLNGCTFTWQPQPSIPGVKGEGNLALSAGLFFSGIQCAKFQQFASAINLNFIGADLYYTLREKYVFPAIDSYWQTEQNRVLNSLKDRG